MSATALPRSVYEVLTYPRDVEPGCDVDPGRDDIERGVSPSNRLDGRKQDVAWALANPQ